MRHIAEALQNATITVFSMSVLELWAFKESFLMALGS